MSKAPRISTRRGQRNVAHLDRGQHGSIQLCLLVVNCFDVNARHIHISYLNHHKIYQAHAVASACSLISLGRHWGTSLHPCKIIVITIVSEKLMLDRCCWSRLTTNEVDGHRGRREL